MSDVSFGLCSVNVNEMVRILSKSYINLIKNNIPFQKFPSAMLWGAPGVGKSQGVREIATAVENATHKKVNITDVRLLLFNPVDLRGIPTVNADKTLAIWLKPQIFQMDDSKDVVNILFLDEISAAPPSVQAAAYQITLDRTVGEHKLPDNCIVIAAGNRVTDKSVAYTMPKALSNRLMHFEIKSDAAAWHDWAVKSAIHHYVVGYLDYNSVALMKFEDSGIDLAFPTPRSWEMVSNVLNFVSDDINEVFPMIVGCIGHNQAYYFKKWCELYRSVPDAEEIFNRSCNTVVNQTELLIALRSLLVAKVRVYNSKEQIDRSIDYACRLPWSFRKKLLHDYYQIAQIRPIVEENEIFKEAVRNSK
ncbi:MAG: MoxR family ATPase [Clostridia bacterium]|nr:MoxR family ATPase [Clostridia bacterium]